MLSIILLTTCIIGLITFFVLLITFSNYNSDFEKAQTEYAKRYKTLIQRKRETHYEYIYEMLNFLSEKEYMPLIDIKEHIKISLQASKNIKDREKNELPS